MSKSIAWDYLRSFVQIRFGKGNVYRYAVLYARIKNKEELEKLIELNKNCEHKKILESFPITKDPYKYLRDNLKEGDEILYPQTMNQECIVEI